MLRVLTLSTLYPSAARPNFGVFVANRQSRLGAREDVSLAVVAPRGLPPQPLALHPHYRALLAAPDYEHWAGLPTYRPRFLHLPAIGWRFDASLIARACARVLDGLDQRFDVLNAEFFFPDGVAAAILARRLRLPFTIQARGSDIHFWGGRAPARRVMLRAACAAAGLRAVSAALKADMVALGMEAERIEVHHTGVDLDRFRPGDRATLKARWGISGPLVVSAGNLVPLKGHEIVIRAVASLPGISLLVAGQGPERDRLQQLIDTLNVADRVRLLGAVPHAEVPDLLAAADVMALASEREGLANVWLEALACGTPVIAPSVGGIAEVLDRPAAGRIVERSAAAFADAIPALLASPPTATEVRATAERFSWDAATERLYGQLSRAAAAKPRA